MEATRRTKESVKKPQNQLYEIRAKKRPIVVTMEKNKGAKASSLKKVLFTRKENMLPCPSTFSISSKEKHSSSGAMN